MTANVGIVDYGVGNLFSVRRAFEYCGADVVVSADPDVLRSVQRLVLPGVGAFPDGMKGLISRGLDTVVLEYAASGRPLLGICLGMQLLASIGEEFGEHAGLDLIPARVCAIPSGTTDGRSQKIPHVGWASLKPAVGRTDFGGSILAGLAPGDFVYLVHSFAVYPDDASYRLADYDYGGHQLAAAIAKKHVFGTQFHPEKSGAVGLVVVRNFLAVGS